MTTADDYVLQTLVDNSLLSDDIIEAARAQLDENDERDEHTAILDMLIEHEYVNYEQIIELFSNEFNMEVVDLGYASPEDEVLKLVPRKEAVNKKIFPLQVDGNELTVAICDPLDVDTLDSIGHITGKTVTPCLALPDQIESAIKNHYGSEDTQEMSGMFAELQGEGTQEGGGGISIEADTTPADENEAPIIRYVFMIITEAIKKDASDIHLEPLEKRFRMRYRIDGVLHEMENPPKRLQPSIISRLKLMANVSIAEKRKPQDGRIQVNNEGKSLDLRVSVLPTAFGESIVMRILDKEGLKLGLPQLGFFSDDQETFEKLINMPDGVFLVTGPTGSGKSTTLYSALNTINKPDRKIITVEDPVEYMVAGINQVPVRKDVGMTFATALRSMLRQAPNIVMVGEIRDLETAEISINAALTGHMVFSTLHTNDAPSAVTRLVDIGVKPYLVSAALRGVLAQRLVRKIHPDCKVPYQPEERELIAVGLTPDEAQKSNFYTVEPTTQCPTGYKGRSGLFELFAMNEELEAMVYKGATIVELRNKARETGMRTMREDGIRKLTSGVTTLDELLKVTV